MAYACRPLYTLFDYLGQPIDLKSMGQPEVFSFTEYFERFQMRKEKYAILFYKLEKKNNQWKTENNVESQSWQLYFNFD